MSGPGGGRRTYDLVVVGGGINGTGIARDAALRGFDTLLLEKRDLCSGATGGCSGMIHGGLRYMLSDLDTTRRSCLDGGFIQRIAPHLLFRIPFLYPVVEGSPLPRLTLELLETYFEGYDRFQPLKGGKPHTRLSREEVRRLEPGIGPAIAGAVTMDEWGIDPFRLVVANALACREAGGEVRVHQEVVGFVREAGRVVGVEVRDGLTGDEFEVRSRLVFCATGPWLPHTQEMAGTRSIRIRPSKGVHLVLDRRLSNYGIITTALDGRSIFLMPHGKGSLIGTTDDDYFGDPDDIPILQDEVEYLLASIERVLPDIRRARIVRAFAALRPTLAAYGKPEDDLSRNHRIYDHAVEDGVPGLMSIAGGKLAAYRLMSEEAVDAAEERLGGPRKPCTTHSVPLPGGEAGPRAEELAREAGLPLPIARSLVFRHGSRAREVIALLGEDQESGRVVCRCEGILEAEVRHAVRREWVRTGSDLVRRTRLGTGPCQGRRCLLAAAAVAAREVGAPMADFVEDLGAERFRGRRAVQWGDTAAHEEFLHWAHLASAHLSSLSLPRPHPWPGEPGGLPEAVVPAGPEGGSSKTASSPRGPVRKGNGVPEPGEALRAAEGGVLVVGSGLAGSLAALVLAGRGQRVVVVGKGEGATSLSSGCLDATGMSPSLDPARFLAASLTEPEHPYRLAGTSEVSALAARIEEAFAFLRSHLGGRFPLAGSIARRVRVPTEEGTWKTTSFAHVNLREPAVRPGDTVAVLGVEDLADSAPARWAFSMASCWPGEDGVRFVPVRAAVPPPLPSPADRPALARLLDDPEAARAFGERLREPLGALGARFVVVPPVFGLGQAAAALDAFAQAAGVPASEAVAVHDPVVPGFRLARALEAALDGAGVFRVRGEVVAARLEAGRVVAVSVRLGGQDGRECLAAVGSVVLATGKFLGGGIRRRTGTPGGGRLEEPVFDLPVRLGGNAAAHLDPEKALLRHPHRRQPWFGVGIQVDGAMRPLGASGRPLAANLFACGQVLAGTDVAGEGCGAGASVLTAFLAGHRAADAFSGGETRG